MQDRVTEDLGQVWEDVRRRVVALTGDLSTAELARAVPATPDWTVHDLLAHNVGCAADNAADRMDGAPGPAWTDAQVSSRAGRSVGELHAEWDQVAPVAAAVVRAGRVPLLMDLTVHEQDLRGALHAPGHRDGPATRACLDGLAARFLHRVGKAGLPLAAVHGEQWSAGGPGPAVRATEFELLRALTGRRSAAQVRAWDWDLDPGPYLDHLSPFGPLRADDLVEG